MAAFATSIARRLRHRGRLPRLRSQVHVLRLPLARDEATGWKPFHLFRGSTRIVGTLGCHVSVLEPGHSPHAPHDHTDDELLTVLDGEATLIVGDEARRVGPGTLAFYPAGLEHTILNDSARPVTYAMLKWASLRPKPGARLGYRLVPFAVDADAASAHGSHAFVQLLQGRTRSVELRVHATTMLPGGGYAEHADPYDVWILVLAGEVETLGRRVGPHAVAYYAKGEPHGMRAVGEEPAFYLVAELRRRRTLRRRR